MNQENLGKLKLLFTDKWITPILVSCLSFIFYVETAAPGLTWANQGADGGDLLTAAVTNGVPHPPGYPLYTLLLQFWLWLLGFLQPAGDLAWRGNLLSALCAALSVGITVATALHVLRDLNKSAWPAAIVGLGWAVSPLLWSQATITEVYGLHALFFSTLGFWAVHRQSARWPLILLAMVGVAHHLTMLTLLPAALYLQWSKAQEHRLREAITLLALLGIGLALGFAWHMRTLWVAALAAPVNWGYATNWQDFWWLISGQAYRGYLLGASASVTFDRLAAWAYTLTTQYTPAGLAIALVGLSYLDQERAALRNFSILWLLPVSTYSILYYTRDSEIYLLPVGWLLTIWLAVGLAILNENLARWLRHSPVKVSAGSALLLGLAILLLTSWRWSTFSLRNDVAAREFLAESAAVVAPNSIIVSRGDEHTFALWYGVWAGKELPANLVLVNDSLTQFEWYRRLLAQVYPNVPGLDQPIQSLIEQNRAERQIFLADENGLLPADALTPIGPLWKVK